MNYDFDGLNYTLEQDLTEEFNVFTDTIKNHFIQESIVGHTLRVSQRLRNKRCEPLARLIFKYFSIGPIPLGHYICMEFMTSDDFRIDLQTELLI